MTPATARRPSLVRNITRRLLMLGGAMIALQFVVVVLDYALEDEKMSILMAQHEAAAIAEGIDKVDGRVTLALSRRAEERYRVFANDYAFRVVAADGAVLMERNPDLINAVPIARTGLPRFLTDTRHINGITTRVSVESFESRAGPVWIAVAIRRDPAGLYRLVLLRETLSHVAEPMLPLLVLSLLVSILAVRRGLRPLTAAARGAAALRADAAALRIPDANLPSEVAEIVLAINSALDRLHRAFESQREFLAIAAHELRTPLAILMLQLGKISGPEAVQLRRDVEQMSRLVNQLLLVARLEGSAPPDMGTIDLAPMARGVVERLLPLALDQQRSIAFEDHGAPPVRGNADMLSDALRNLVENALHHAPSGTSITVASGPGPTLSVSDHGPGVAEAERERIFQRFAHGIGSSGAGLGLFIVRRIAEAHGGAVSVLDAEGGGARFVLSVPPLDPRHLPSTPRSQD